MSTIQSLCMQEFQELWAEYDDGSGTIAPEQLQTLLIRTDPPLGLGRMATGRDVLRFVFNLDIPLVNGRVPFHRTVYELVRNVSETQIPEVGQSQTPRLHAYHTLMHAANIQATTAMLVAIGMPMDSISMLRTAT